MEVVKQHVLVHVILIVMDVQGHVLVDVVVIVKRHVVHVLAHVLDAHLVLENQLDL